MENVAIIDISPQIDVITKAPYRCGVPTPDTPPWFCVKIEDPRYNTNWSFNFLRICCKPIEVQFYDSFSDISQTGRR